MCADVSSRCAELMGRKNICSMACKVRLVLWSTLLQEGLYPHYDTLDEGVL
jgi:hypothetical protein